jgi:hypothetical protein
LLCARVAVPEFVLVHHRQVTPLVCIVMRCAAGLPPERTLGAVDCCLADNLGAHHTELGPLEVPDQASACAFDHLAEAGCLGVHVPDWGRWGEKSKWEV